MLKRRLAITGLLLAIIFGAGLLGGFLLPRLASRGSAPKVYNTATLLLQVKTVSELVTVKYVIEKVVVLEVPPESLVGKMFAGENRVLMLAHGIVKGGIDLARLKPDDLQVSQKKVVVKLPPAQIIDAYLDEKQTRVIERKTGGLWPFDNKDLQNKDLEQTVRRNAIDDISRAARSAGIYKDADERARAQLTSLFRQLGFEQIEFRGH